MNRRICLPSGQGIHNGRKTLSLCGSYEDARDLTMRVADATCPDCLAEDARLSADTRTVEDVFGTDEEIRSFGPPVRSHYRS